MKKTNVLISLLASFLVSTTVLAAVPTTELVKIEPVELAKLTIVKAALQSSMSALKVDFDYSQSIKAHKMALISKQPAKINIVNVASNQIVSN